MNLDLDELERLARQATPAPWFNTSEDDRPTGSVATNPLTNDIVLTWSDGRAKADAAFIAAANPSAVLRLVEIARAAQKAKAVLEEIAHDLATAHLAECRRMYANYKPHRIASAEAEVKTIENTIAALRLNIVGKGER